MLDNPMWFGLIVVLAAMAIGGLAAVIIWYTLFDKYYK